MQGVMFNQSTSKKNNLNNNNNNNKYNTNKNPTTTSQKSQLNKTKSHPTPKHNQSPKHSHNTYNHPHSTTTTTTSAPKCCLTLEQLERFYKNNNRRVNNSFLHHLTHPYSKSLCQHLPLSLPTNLLSILGFFVNVFSTILLLYHCQTTKSEVPRWVYLTAALGLLSFQSLNTIDKTHLQNIDNFTPFREFGLHCIDVISNAFTVIGATATTHLTTHPPILFTITTFSLILYYLTHWQTYCTGIFNTQIFDVNEVRALVVGIHVVTFVTGSQVWEVAFLNPTWPLKLLPVTFCLLICLFYTFRHLSSIMVEGGVGRNGSTLAGTSVLSPLVPIGCSLSVGVSVMKNSRMVILNSHPLLFTTTYIITILKITIQVIISHMSQSAMILCDPILLGPIAHLIGQYFNWLDDYKLMILSLSVCIFYFSYFSLRLWRDILNYKPK